MMEKRPPSWQAKAGAYLGLVWVLPSTMLACWFLGDWLGAKAGSNVGGLVGLMIGFAAGLYETIRQADRIEGIKRR
jgi:hypothetical protein